VRNSTPPSSVCATAENSSQSESSDGAPEVGDTLLVQAPPETLDRLSIRDDVIVAREPPRPEYRSDKALVAVAIMIGVVAVAALELYPILISALAGVVAMVITGVLKPNELYDAIEWDIIFLLAGIIPLGIALQSKPAQPRISPSWLSRPPASFLRSSCYGCSTL